MPSVRTEKKKNLTPGEQFALVLGLEDRPQTFEQFKKVFRGLANDTFDFNLPVFQQQTAMSSFVQKVVKLFPGYFNERCENNNDRLTHLQRYARSYLEKSGKLSTSNKKHPRKSQAAKTVDAAAPPSPPPSPPKDKVIKVERPKPRPLSRAPKTNIFTAVDEPMPAAPPVDTPASNRGPVQGPAQGVKAKPSNAKTSNAKTSIVVEEPMPAAPPIDTPAPNPASAKGPAQRVRPKPSNAKTNIVVEEPMPAAPPIDTPAPNPASAKGPAQRVKSKPLNAKTVIDEPMRAIDTAAPKPAPAHGSVYDKALDATAATASPNKKQVPAPAAAGLPKFLASCCPAMGHCAAAFERAGVVEQTHLVGMAHWSDENVRRFLTANGIGRTALDVEAIVIGLAALLSEHVA
ncbi:hypothetical protein C8R44DRAFT_975420 [Mycena epipterygia]|nr:hypothetical protein C8R44DRAFT_975420 [Mycena epipterygia]